MTRKERLEKLLEEIKKGRQKRIERVIKLTKNMGRVKSRFELLDLE